MCMMCQGWSRADMIAMLRDRILRYGYTIIDISADGPGGEGGQLLPFPDSSTHLIYANEFYRKAGRPPVPALQLLWPHREPLLNGSSPA